MFNPQHKAFLSSYLLIGYLTCLAPAGRGQSIGQNSSQTGATPVLGQSDWQTINSVPSQQASGQSLGQSEWQRPDGNSLGSNQVPGLTTNPANNTSQNPWQNPSAGMSQYQANSQSSGQSNGQSNGQNSAGYGLSPWQQPQNAVQTNTSQNPSSQQNSDYYYGQVNQGQQNPYASNNGQYQQGQVNNSAQPNNNQWSNNLPPASSIPVQPTQAQTSSGGLKKTLAGLARTATQAAGMGMGVAAPFAGVYMMSRAMTNTTPSYGYGYPGAMPYGGYGGYGGYPAPMPYAAPNYAMMNMAPMYSSALSGLSSFMTH